MSEANQGLAAEPAQNGMLPRPNAVSRPFWEAAKQHRLVIQRSTRTGKYLFYPRIVSPLAAGDTLEWVEVSGHGTVVGSTVVRASEEQPWSGRVPYVLAIVELDEGPRMTSTIVGCEPEAVHAGMAITAIYDDVTPDVTLVRFRPV
jgi:uncharacterized OB-fold protein